MSAVLPATPAASPAVTPTPRPTGLGEIRWSSEELTAATPATGVTQLPIDAPRIVASVPGYSLPVGVQVSAAWFYNDTTLDAFATTLTVDQAQAEQWFAFQITRNSETPWPPGVYEITISLDGQASQSSAVEVVPLS
ncbi:MAG: hypothetical protein KC442_14270 [Thermomicrobiales bacterium]|nr:hypothetical protein [Thermomicrobiales bacterium]